MENKHKVYNLIILDESGSMGSIKDMIISGFNEVVQTVKGVAEQFPEQEHRISFVSFNGIAVKTHLENELVTELELIDGSKYRPSASTPLFDAMGESLSKLQLLTDKEQDYNVLVTILTDGMENASKEYNGASIKKMVDELSLKNWTFTYIGADHDVESFAASISIKNTMRFNKNAADMNRMFDREKNSRMTYSYKIRGKEDTSANFYTDEPDDSKR